MRHRQENEALLISPGPIDVDDDLQTVDATRGGEPHPLAVRCVHDLDQALGQIARDGNEAGAGP